jgi:tRNA G10  N-methylase Trm11
MADFSAKSLAILGRQPALGVAELERLYGARHIRPIGGAALLDKAIPDIQFKHLGGTIKLARVLTILPTTDWAKLIEYLKTQVPMHLKLVPEGGFTLGLSVYGLAVSPRKINQDLLSLKKVVKASGRSIRVVPNKSSALNSAQVLHNKLTTRGAWELLLVRDGQQTFLAQTMFVQDIGAYAARDQARPARDARVGMLPPKLAQIMINLAKPSGRGAVLDPFCGSGVILQEALLMGYSVVGSDIDPRMVKFTKANMDWLSNKYDIPPSKYQILIADARIREWLSDIDSIVSETYLGKPLKKLPAEHMLNLIVDEIDELIEKFLLNLSQQLKSGSSLCLAVPAWRKADRGFIKLPIIAKITDMGYTYLDLKHVSRDDLIYFREDQIVARQLLILRKV